MALTSTAALNKDRTSAIGANMEHRHFALIARILRDMNAPEDMCEKWADELRHTNPRFDRARFLRACQS